MKKSLVLAGCFFLIGVLGVMALPITPTVAATGTAISQDGSEPNANAMLDIQSPATGDGKGLLIPRMSGSQRTNANSSVAGGLLSDSGALRGGAAQGLLVYQTDGTQGFYYNTSSSSTPSWSFLGDSGGGSSSAIGAYGYCYQLATIADATVVGGADVPFSNNGPLSGGVTHTASTTTIAVPETGTYKIDYSISITAGVGSQIAVAVNGTVDSSTPVTSLVATGNISGTTMLSLVAGDVLTLRNNSMVPLTMDLAPAVSAQFSVMKLD